jgi:hypothetical protein
MSCKQKPKMIAANKDSKKIYMKDKDIKLFIDRLNRPKYFPGN